ncbi:hypothetical protein FHX37_3522 [Haloactinospora alba]|uniref:Uncharacterized protein n=1 Tax=Haloactinospora alba TaxID=405555 RepID=A0A543NNT5_9ACTN|nr:hypothetical protein [Haloactinospora alba]TQN33501.1 hypothetical protein FHX37_3522 [Haloactinospora alba]
MEQLPQPRKPGQLWPESDAVFLNLGRSARKLRLAILAGVLFFTCTSAAGAIWPERFLDDGSGTAERVISAVFAVFLALVSLVIALMLVPTLFTHGLAVDRRGVWFLLSGRAEPVYWHQIRAIGGSWKEYKRTFKAGLGSRLGQELARSIVSENGKHMFALEVYPHDPDAFTEREPFSIHLRQTAREEPPVAGLPNARLRFPVPGNSDYREMAWHLYRTAPHLWIGEHQRDSVVW